MTAATSHWRAHLTPAFAQRFWALVTQAADPASCWPWCGAPSANDPNAYSIRVGGQSRSVRLVAWLLTHPADPAPRQTFPGPTCVLSCVRPSHITPGGRPRAGVDPQSLPAWAARGGSPYWHRVVRRMDWLPVEAYVAYCGAPLRQIVAAGALPPGAQRCRQCPG